MKTIKLLLASVLFAGAAALAFAGPGPDYFARVNKAEKDRAEAKTQPAQAKTQPAAQVTACSNCNCAAMKKS